MRALRRWLAVVAVFVAVAAAPSVALASDWVPAGTPIRAVVLGRSAAHVIDDASWGVRASVKLPEGLMQTWWKSADGRYLAVVTQEGILRHKGPARLVVIDAVEARLVTTTNLDFETASALASEAGNVAAKRRAAKVELLDAATLETVATLDLPGPAGGLFWTPDRALVYALDPGIDSKAAPRRCRRTSTSSTPRAARWSPTSRWASAPDRSRGTRSASTSTCSPARARLPAPAPRCRSSRATRSPTS